MNIKKISRVNQQSMPHWVGDGFLVHQLLSYHTDGATNSPFILLDYASPIQFPPSNNPRGIGYHPHRGFETVTIVYQGEIEHKDNAGHSGKIGPGDVQWMTAGQGVLHQEMHSKAFTSQGGSLEMVQLWVNLPAKFKMSSPHYQEILKKNIPVITLDDHQSQLRVIAGQFQATNGVARTFTPINLWDLELKTGFKMNVSLPVGYNTILVVLKGCVWLNDEREIKAKTLICFEQDNEYIHLDAAQDSSILILNGQPINEPIVGQGPFVMNTKTEITQAFDDYHMGRF